MLPHPLKKPLPRRQINSLILLHHIVLKISRKRTSLFSKRTIAPSRVMHEDTLKAIGCFDEVKNLLLVSGLFQFTFNALPSYPTLIVEFLSSFTLRSINYDNENPYFSMRFQLGGRDRFMTYQEFDTLFGFGQEGHVQTPPHWFGNSFWNDIMSSQASSFSAGHTKSSHIKSKALWYLYRFISYSINARAIK